MYYRLPDKDAPTFIHDAIDWVMTTLAKEKQTVEDGKRLKTILKMEPESSCVASNEKRASESHATNGAGSFSLHGQFLPAE